MRKRRPLRRAEATAPISAKQAGLGPPQQGKERVACADHGMGAQRTHGRMPATGNTEPADRVDILLSKVAAD